MNVDPEVVGHCQRLLRTAWLSRLEGNYPQAQSYEQEARDIMRAAGVLLSLSQVSQAKVA